MRDTVAMKRARHFAEMLEALELVSDLSSTEWQSEDGKRHAAVGNDGERLVFISRSTLDAVRAAIANVRGGVPR